MESTAINVVLVGGDVLLREGLRRLLLGGPIQVAEAFSDLPGLFARDLRADTRCIILLGRPEGQDLTDIVDTLKAVLPGVRVVLLESEKDPEATISGLRAGVDGYFHLGISAEALVHAVVTTIMGEPIVATRMVGPLLPEGPVSGAGLSAGPTPTLSERERAILDCLVRGDANKEIGRRFGVSEASVKRQVRALLQKLGVANRTQAAVWALEHNVGR